MENKHRLIVSHQGKLYMKISTKRMERALKKANNELKARQKFKELNNEETTGAKRYKV